MRTRNRAFRRALFLCLAACALTAVSASAQNRRMRAYEKEVEQRIGEAIESFRQLRLEAARAEARAKMEGNRDAVPRGGRPDVSAAVDEDPTVAELTRPFEYVVNLQDSNDGDGQDVEIRITMPVDEFMEFAPIAALEAAAAKHKFPVVYIYLREETTDRVARVAFKDAEPIAGRYLAGDTDAVDEMSDILIWH